MARIASISLALIFLLGCSGGTPFVPLIGPYSGNFLVEGEAVGNLTLTASDGLLGGTGMLTHNNQPVNVSISAAIDGRSFSGTVSNASLGAGYIVGSFGKQGRLSGEFNYEDSGQISVTRGTWSADIEDWAL